MIAGIHRLAPGWFRVGNVPTVIGTTVTNVTGDTATLWVRKCWYCGSDVVQEIPTEPCPYCGGPHWPSAAVPLDHSPYGLRA